MIKLFLSLVLFLSLIINSIGASVTLAWDASPDPSVTGYRIYYGGSSGIYTNSVNTGNNLSVTILNLNNNTTYYFAAVSYDSSGTESEFSNQVSFFTPALVTNNPPTISFINNQIINRNSTGPKIPFIIYDSDSPITNLVLSTSFTNLTLFASNSFVFTGAGTTNRNLYITPKTNQIGRDYIQVSVTDNFTNKTTSSFIVDVVVPQNLVYLVSRLEYGTNLSNLQKTNVLLKIFTNPPPGQFYRQYLVITNNF